MSRKHSTARSLPASTSPSSTAVAPPPRESAPARPPSDARPASPAAASTRVRPEERFWLEVAVIRASRWLGSLQLAVVLLIWFAAVLAVGTAVESWYSGRIAQELVYRTWWFVLLLGLLAVNIFFAAAKKWPWKKHQTGFLITHLGLLTMIAGGVITWMSGTDGEMQLIATDDPRFQRQFGLHQASNRAVLRDDQIIRVHRLAPDSDGKTAEYAFEPGPLPWRSDEHLQSHPHPLLAVLGWLAHPLPRSWEADLGDGTHLSVLAYYPHARTESYSPGPPNAPGSAVKLQLKGPMPEMLRSLGEPWLAWRPDADAGRDDQTLSLGPARIEFVGKVPPALLNEFLHPAEQDRQGQGTLVLRLFSETCRFAVKECLGKERPAGGTGCRVKITQYQPDAAGDSDKPVNPLLRFEVIGADGTTTQYATLGRDAGVAWPMKDGQLSRRDPNQLQVWYHPPDPRFGSSQVRGLLQFATCGDDKLYYRSLHGDPFRFETSGEASAEQGFYPIWKNMGFQFHVREYLPHAVKKPRYVPVEARPGFLSDRLSAALRCRLSVGDRPGEEFWVSEGAGAAIGHVGKQAYEVTYGVRSRPLDFEIKLLRAEQEKDAGTQSAATYTSYVQLSDPGTFSAPWIPFFLRGLTNFLGLTDGGEPIEAQDQVITMNQPLSHRGYKVYQSSYRFLDWDDSQKPVSYSGFTIGRDPGLWLKYLGSTMLAVGIACMYYMKAYFFKRRPRPAAV